MHGKIGVFENPSYVYLPRDKENFIYLEVHTSGSQRATHNNGFSPPTGGAELNSGWQPWQQAPFFTY